MADLRAWRGILAALLLHLAVGAAAMGFLEAAIHRRLPPPPPHPAYPVAHLLMPAADPAPRPAPPAPPAMEEPAPLPPDPGDAAVLATPALEGPDDPLRDRPGAVPAAAAAGDPALFRVLAPPRRHPPAPAVAAVTGWNARPLAQEPPAYPDSARRAGREGTVVLRLRVAADGTVGDAAVAATSGSPDLDRAACDAARRWRFAPPAAQGLPGAEVRLAVAFRLGARG